MKQIILALTLVAAPVLAQPAGLNLTDAQRDQIKQILREQRDEAERLRRQTRERIAAVLTPEQRQQWEERRKDRLERQWRRQGYRRPLGIRF
jgi:Spy/CpxP family protein refolding chaperone